MVEAVLTLRGEGASAVGRDRIRLLEAVGRAGSITGGARAVGLTYKAAWDALDAMARLFSCPVLDTRVGGRAGGGACLTPAGARLIREFARLEADVARAARQLDGLVGGGALSPGASVLRTSARNTLPGTVIAVAPDALTAAVTVALEGGGALQARVTGESRRGLALAEGRAVVALVKASFIALARPDEAAASAEVNRLHAVVRHRAVAGDQAEVLLDIGGTRVLAVTTTARRVAELDLGPGQPVEARIPPETIILATADDGAFP